MVRLSGCVLAIVAVLGVCSGAAQGATVSLAETAGDQMPKGGVNPAGVVTVTAGDGEANTLTFAMAGASLVVRDPHAPLVPGAGCAATAPGEVTCTGKLAPVTDLAVDALDGADVIDASGLAIRLRADGGEGDDLIRGGSSNDLLRAGKGDDRVEGGAGDDTADYADRVAGVTVALDGSAPSGEPGEADTLVDLENATGGRGPDTITGTAARNSLVGGAGDDRLQGADGVDTLNGGLGADLVDGGADDDVVVGGPGADRLLGGAGEDVLSGQTGADQLDGGGDDDVLQVEGDSTRTAGETAVCGAGRDRVSAPDGRERIAADCETVALGPRDIDLEPLVVRLPLRALAGGRIAVRLAADDYDAEETVHVRLVVHVADHPPLARRTTVAPGRTRTLRLPAGARTGDRVRLSITGTARGGFSTPLA